ncbi:TPA: hypothetical protein DIU22_02080 [Candidatus Woesebacteria bacterium]|nr:hypothetical protein [Candidatus Woesebacteria bacterium]
MSKLIILSGLQASGKSTKAKKIVTQGNWVRLNKDLLRTMLHFDKFSGRNEGLTRDAERTLAKTFLKNDINVVVDDTNLGEQHKQSWQALAIECNASFEHTFIDTELNECLNRNTNRANPVPSHVIVQTAMQYQMYPQPKKSFVICDLDGTLADITHRLHFVKVPDGQKKNWNAFFENVYYDAVRWDIVKLLKEYVSQGHPFVLVSGRPERCRADTEKWLFEQIYDNLEWQGLDKHITLIMRQNHDKRDDDILKTDIYNKYLKHYPIEVVIDDRPRVLRAWAMLKLRTIDVGPGIEF